MPTPVPGQDDPSIVVPTAIPIAASAWNDAISNAWPNVTVCERDVSCPTLHDDRQTITINTVDNSGGNNCNNRAACVTPRPGPHIGNREMKIGLGFTAELTFGFITDTYEILWTNDQFEDQEPNHAALTFKIYLPSVLMHEFGHALGLADLYLDGYNDYYGGYLMDDTYGFTAIQDEDIRYAHQVYRNRHGAKAH